MIADQEKKIVKDSVIAIIEELSLELVDFQMKQSGRTVIIDVLADRINGGITVDECSQINKKLNWVIEEKALFNDDFIIEVSSPGLDRPLATDKDFMRVIGKQVVFYLNDLIEGKKEHTGEITRVEAVSVWAKVKESEIQIPLAKINKAVQIL